MRVIGLALALALALALVPQAPAAPGNFVILPAVGGDHLQLLWDVPVNADGEACTCVQTYWKCGVLLYQVKVGTTPEVRKQSTALAPEYHAGVGCTENASLAPRSWRYTRGVAGTRYYFVLRSRNTWASSDWSEEVSGVFP